MPSSPPRQANRRGVTPEEVARTAGVSPATAARVAGGSPQVSQHSRRAVKDAIERLDYVSSPGPRRLTMASNSVGVVIAEPTTNLFHDEFYAPLLKGIQANLAEREKLLVMFAASSRRDTELVQAYLTDRHVDGVILVGLHGDHPLPALLEAARIPTVICGRPPKGISLSSVDSDNRQGGQLAVEHLLSLGRKCIATISGNLDMPSAVDRLGGYRSALAAAGVAPDPTLEEVGDYSPDRAHMAMERLLLNHPNVDGVFAASDHMAAAAIDVLRQARKRVPEDVAVIGFDDAAAAMDTQPPLSSIRQMITEMGRGAVELVMREIDEPGQPPRQLIFSMDLVIRASTVGDQSQPTIS
jgi:DNA-binding LacI/PurR family transcriptional regulator